MLLLWWGSCTVMLAHAIVLVVVFLLGCLSRSLCSVEILARVYLCAVLFPIVSSMFCFGVVAYI